MKSSLLNFIKENVEQINTDFKEDYNLSSKEVEKVSNIIRNDQSFLDAVWEALNESFDYAIKELTK